jgi:hypothetical protein
VRGEWLAVYQELAQERAPAAAAVCDARVRGIE